jgi:hypothetical protein
MILEECLFFVDVVVVDYVSPVEEVLSFNRQHLFTNKVAGENSIKYFPMPDHVVGFVFRVLVDQVTYADWRAR